MGELLCHLFGDFVLQNHAMATRKTSSSRWAAVHVLFYTLPFLFLTRSPLVLSIVAGTHFVIDRWSLAKRWPGFWGVGCEGWVGRKIREWRRDRAVANHLWVGDRLGLSTCEPYLELVRSDFPLPEAAPPFLAVWLAIIVDNTFHLLINHLALMLR